MAAPIFSDFSAPSRLPSRKRATAYRRKSPNGWAPRTGHEGSPCIHASRAPAVICRKRLGDTSDEWIRTRTGIKQRHVAAEGETTTDLAEHAARRAIADAGVTAQ